ncbi:hypothetical protein TCSYLVIO_007736 [Trypanosoma cruzi]|nr:hypothetical protein TCSYLVIO_007736 [Trypanosoma cruzi]
MLYGKYLRCALQKSAVTLPFILHSPFTYHWEARSHHSSVPLPVLLVSLHWRKLSPHIPITMHCGIQTNHTAWVRCHPANKPQEIPRCLVRHGRQYHYACKRLFSQTRTRLHHTPVKTFGPSHAKDWSGRTAGKTTPAAMSSPHTPTHRCPAYHQKQKYQRNMSHPNCKSQVRLQHTLPPPGRVRPLAARRSKWDRQKHQFEKVRPPPQQSRPPFLTMAKAYSGAADGGTHSRRVMDCRGNHATAMRPSFLGSPTKTCVAQSP